MLKAGLVAATYKKSLQYCLPLFILALVVDLQLISNIL